jgi:hypothetical protein
LLPAYVRLLVVFDDEIAVEFDFHAGAKAGETGS